MDRPHSRPFPFLATPSQAIQQEHVSFQLVRRCPPRMTKHWQKFHGTKLAQSGTKLEPSYPGSDLVAKPAIRVRCRKAQVPASTSCGCGRNPVDCLFSATRRDHHVR